MQDRQLYERILGIGAPWHVDRVEFWRHLDTCQYHTVLHAALPRADMWEPYFQSIHCHLSDARATIVFDKSHVAKHLGGAVGKVRRTEHKNLHAAGDERLQGTKYDWLKGRMLKNHLPRILTYLVHGITNAMSESMNSKIQWVKYAARGFRNVDNFKNPIYFHCGDLDLAPRPTWIPEELKCVAKRLTFQQLRD